MITEDYVSFETAKLLKEKGFGGNIHAYYHIWDNGTKVCSVREFIHSEAPHLYIPAPTHQMAVKWLREVHNIIISIAPQKDKYYFTPWQHWDSEWVRTKAMLPLYDTYEQACEAAIKYCLEHLI